MNDATSVLVVEDDRNIVDVLQANLLVRGFDVLVSRTGAGVLDRIGDEQIDLVLLDLMLPGLDGFDLCREIAPNRPSASSSCPHGAASRTRCDALNVGADDYLTKPFGVDELLARITAHLSRSRWRR